MLQNKQYPQPIHTKLSKWSQGVIFAKGLLFQSAAFILKKNFNRRRTQVVVNSVYEHNKYKKILEDKEWAKFNNLEEYLAYLHRSPLISLLGNDYVNVDPQGYSVFRRKYLRSIIEKFLEPSDEEVVELGCGSGIQLFYLSDMKNITFQGFDISKNSIEVANQVKSHFNIENVSFKLVDLVNPDENLEYIRNKVVFTHHCLEQLKLKTPEVLKNILTHKPKLVIHIEPTVETLSIRNPKDWAQIMYSKREGYLDNLLQELNKLKPTIELCYNEKLPFAPSIYHSSNLVVWKPAKRFTK